MILLIVKRVRELEVSKAGEAKEAIRRAVLEYFWDTWIHWEIQQATFLDGGEDMEWIGDESRVTSGTIKAIRHVSPDTNEVV